MTKISVSLPYGKKQSTFEVPEKNLACVLWPGAVDDLQQRLRKSPKAAGQNRIYVHGEKEYERAERRSREGIPLNPKVRADLKRLAERHDVEFSP